jgi:hypothetical protein
MKGYATLRFSRETARVQETAAKTAASNPIITYVFVKVLQKKRGSKLTRVGLEPTWSMPCFTRSCPTTVRATVNIIKSHPAGETFVMIYYLLFIMRIMPDVGQPS